MKTTDIDINSIRNDTDIPTGELLDQLNSVDTVELNYGDFIMKIERFALDQAIREIIERSPEVRTRITASVDRCLRKALPKIKSGRFSRKAANNFYQDLVLWEALKQVGTTS